MQNCIYVTPRGIDDEIFCWYFWSRLITLAYIDNIDPANVEPYK